MTTAPPLATSPEHTLVSRLNAGDECALGELYERYGGMTYSISTAKTRMRAGMEKLRQRLHALVEAPS